MTTSQNAFSPPAWARPGRGLPGPRLRGSRQPVRLAAAPGRAVECQGPIIGLTLNRERSRPNWYITSATRWIRTLSMAVG